MFSKSSVQKGSLEKYKKTDKKKGTQIEITNSLYNYEYLLGILNSKLMIYIYQSMVPEKGKVFAEVKKVNLDQLPIPSLDFSQKSDKDKYDRLVILVKHMLNLKQQEQPVKDPQTKIVVSRQIDAVDRQIDALVYTRYGLSEEKIKVVEGEK
ncbi:MAG: hypothetical protein LBT14_00215 [Treponema sp.]|nr:hypothetical protein [Treponema sp.]